MKLLKKIGFNQQPALTGRPAAAQFVISWHLFFIIIGIIFFSGCTMHKSHPVFKHPEPKKVTEAHYRIYTGNGTPASLDELVKNAVKSDVVFFGEEHNDPVAHFLEKEIFRLIDEREGRQKQIMRELILSMEMFERDVQTVLDEYLKGLISEHHFLKASRPWRNYWTDYRSLIEYARKKERPVVAANAPGRYVNRVSRLGKDSLNNLSSLAKKWLPPLPYADASPAYRLKFKEFQEAVLLRQNIEKSDKKSGLAAKMQKASPHHPVSKDKYDFENLLAAQSLWDAAMADSIQNSLKQHPGGTVFHISGKFHSEQGMGIPEHLKALQPDLNMVIITQVSAAAFPEMPSFLKGYGDFIILTDPNL